MQYRTLGRTGLTVSVVGFGGAPLGIPNYMESWDPGREGERTSGVRALLRAHESGITYWDTAPGYGDGVSERVMGEALKGKRDEIVVATKVGGDWTYDNVIASCEESLQRLGVETIDVFQFHGGHYTDEMARAVLGPGLDAMRRLREDGKIRFVGLTGEGSTGAMERIVDSGALDTMQIGYNICYQHPANYVNKDGIMFQAHAQDMGIVTMRTLSSGLLQRIMGQVFRDAVRDLDLNAFCLNYVLSSPLVDVALVGMRRPEEVDANVAVADDLAGRLDVELLHVRFVD